MSRPNRPILPTDKVRDVRRLLSNVNELTTSAVVSSNDSLTDMQYMAHAEYLALTPDDDTMYVTYDPEGIYVGSNLICQGVSYGGMRTSTNPFYSLGATWTQYTDFDALTAPPHGMEFDVPNNRFRFTYTGIYQINVFFDFIHDEVNQGRTFFFRIFEAAAGIGSDPAPVGIARNVSATSFSVSTQVTMPLVELENWITMEVGNGDAITGNFNLFQINSLSLRLIS